MTVDDEFTAYINGHEVAHNTAGNGAWNKPQAADVPNYLVTGRNVLAVEGRNDGPSPAGVLARLAVELAEGTKVEILTDGKWRWTADQPPAGWQAPGFDDSNWKPARVVGPEGIGPWNHITSANSEQWDPEPPSPMLRKAFTVAKPIKRAVVYICGLGYYDLHLNGKKVGHHQLDPAFTACDHRDLYVTYDVTSLIHSGQNALGVMLGNGFYNQPRLAYVGGTHDICRPSALAD